MFVEMSAVTEREVLNSTSTQNRPFNAIRGKNKSNLDV